MNITGTHINYYFSCHRQLWLFANSIQMEHTNDNVYEGKLIHETSYNQRSSKYEEVAIKGIKIDFYDAKNKIIHEIKKSSKMHKAHVWQVKYYIYILEKMTNISGISGILEYPKERKTEEIFLSTIDIDKIKEIENKINKIIYSEAAPELEKKTRCKNCSYYDFCYINEE
ncbi:MAG: CRISPR-associated protein Cas4 [Bacteroidales bacterium]|jgi:CRISPR-associated exonuclease Cas4|nr:CRISPR-associated protein Cas4 [Bacteroidales bacterium]